MSPRSPLLDLDDVIGRLPSYGRTYLGLRQVPVGRIIGTMDRSGAFDADFRPLLATSQARLDSLARAFADGAFPPINVIEFGGGYFVVDGHHRVRLARQRGMEVLDGEVTRVWSHYELPPDVDVRALIHTQQQLAFLTASGLNRVRPDVDITFSRIQGYPELLEVVQAFAYDESLRAGRLIAAGVASARWYDRDYRPGVAALRREGLHEIYSYKTDADLWLWVHQLQRQLIGTDEEGDHRAAARLAARTRISRSVKRRLLQQRSVPLEPKGSLSRSAPRRRSAPR